MKKIEKKYIEFIIITNNIYPNTCNSVIAREMLQMYCGKSISIEQMKILEKKYSIFFKF